MENNKVIVINLMGGPGSGKSTAASGIFYRLKKMGVNCELVLEFAKDKVWEEAFRTIDDQIYIFAKQYHKLWRLRDKVDVIITDSPLLVSIFYNKTPSKYFNNFVIEQFNSFDNMTYFIERPDRYQQSGRIKEEICFNVPDEDKEQYHFYNENMPITDNSDCGLYCDRCGHSLLMGGNFMLSDMDDTVSEDNDSIGVDCHCPNCGALYSIVERISDRI